MTPADEIRSAIASTDDALREPENYDADELRDIRARQAERKRRLAQMEQTDCAGQARTGDEVNER